MAILNFSGFTDANAYSANIALPAGITNYMHGKFPCFKGNSAFVKDSGDKISGAGTNALNVNTFTPTSAIIDAPLDTNKLIVEVSATDYKP